MNIILYCNCNSTKSIQISPANHYLFSLILDFRTVRTFSVNNDRLGKKPKDEKEGIKDFIFLPRKKLQKKIHSKSGKVFAAAIGCDRFYANQVATSIRDLNCFKPIRFPDLFEEQQANILKKNLSTASLNALMRIYVENGIFQFNPLVFYHGWLQLFFTNPWWRRIFLSKARRKTLPFTLFSKGKMIYIVAPIQRPFGEAFLKTQQKKMEIDRDDLFYYYNFCADSMYLYTLGSRVERLVAVGTTPRHQFWPKRVSSTLIYNSDSFRFRRIWYSDGYHAMPDVMNMIALKIVIRDFEYARTTCNSVFNMVTFGTRLYRGHRTSSTVRYRAHPDNDSPYVAIRGNPFNNFHLYLLLFYDYEFKTNNGILKKRASHFMPMKPTTFTLNHTDYGLIDPIYGSMYLELEEEVFFLERGETILRLIAQRRKYKGLDQIASDQPIVDSIELTEEQACERKLLLWQRFSPARRFKRASMVFHFTALIRRFSFFYYKNTKLEYGSPVMRVFYLMLMNKRKLKTIHALEIALNRRVSKDFKWISHIPLFKKHKFSTSLTYRSFIYLKWIVRAIKNLWNNIANFPNYRVDEVLIFCSIYAITMPIGWYIGYAYEGGIDDMYTNPIYLWLRMLNKEKRSLLSEEAGYGEAEMSLYIIFDSIRDFTLRVTTTYTENIGYFTTEFFGRFADWGFIIPIKDFFHGLDPTLLREYFWAGLFFGLVLLMCWLIDYLEERYIKPWREGRKNYVSSSVIEYNLGEMVGLRKEERRNLRKSRKLTSYERQHLPFLLRLWQRYKYIRFFKRWYYRIRYELANFWEVFFEEGEGEDEYDNFDDTEIAEEHHQDEYEVATVTKNNETMYTGLGFTDWFETPAQFGRYNLTVHERYDKQFCTDMWVFETSWVITATQQDDEFYYDCDEFIPYGALIDVSFFEEEIQLSNSAITQPFDTYSLYQYMFFTLVDLIQFNAYSMIDDIKEYFSILVIDLLVWAVGDTFLREAPAYELKLLNDKRPLGQVNLNLEYNKIILYRKIVQLPIIKYLWSSKWFRITARLVYRLFKLFFRNRLILFIEPILINAIDIGRAFVYIIIKLLRLDKFYYSVVALSIKKLNSFVEIILYIVNVFKIRLLKLNSLIEKNWASFILFLKELLSEEEEITTKTQGQKVNKKDENKQNRG